MQDAWKSWPQVVTPHCVALLAYAIWVPVGTKRSRNKGHILKVCGCPDMPWKRLRCLVPRVSIRSTFSSRILTTLLWAELMHISRWGIKFGDPFAWWELQRKNAKIKMEECEINRHIVQDHMRDEVCNNLFMRQFFNPTAAVRLFSHSGSRLLLFKLSASTLASACEMLIKIFETQFRLHIPWSRVYCTWKSMACASMDRLTRHQLWTPLKTPSGWASKPSFVHRRPSRASSRRAPKLALTLLK